MQKAMQVAPTEVEDVLLGSKDIADAAVAAIWREAEATEVPRAFGMPPYMGYIYKSTK